MHRFNTFLVDKLMYSSELFEYLCRKYEVKFSPHVKEQKNCYVCENPKR